MTHSRLYSDGRATPTKVRGGFVFVSRHLGNVKKAEQEIGTMQVYGSRSPWRREHRPRRIRIAVRSRVHSWVFLPPAYRPHDFVACL
jgi:hypothetical protein